jgi:prepilin-type N-terminal cleavage/methylation domain-containing protein
MRPDTVQIRRAHGFTLVELMIAMTLGLLIMAALVTLFVDTSRTNREMAKTNSQIENARFALQLLEEDFVHGGYWGGFVPQFDDLTYEDVPTDTPAAIPDPCTAFASWDAAYFNGVKGMPVQFYNGVPTGCSGVVTNKLANTDVVVVRHADTCELSWNKTGTATADACSNPVTHSGGAWMPGRCNTDGDWIANSCAAYDAGQVYFQPSRCELELHDTPPKRYVIDTATTDFDLHARQCTGGSPVTGRAAPIYRFISHIYYIRQCATLNVDGTCADSIPTLVRSEFRVQGGTGEHQAAEASRRGCPGDAGRARSGSHQRQREQYRHDVPRLPFQPSVCPDVLPGRGEVGRSRRSRFPHQSRRRRAGDICALWSRMQRGPAQQRCGGPHFRAGARKRANAWLHRHQNLHAGRPDARAVQ